MSGLCESKLHVLVLEKVLTKTNAHFQFLLEQAECHFQVNHCFGLFHKNLLLSLEDILAEICDIKDNIASTLKVH